MTLSKPGLVTVHKIDSNGFSSESGILLEITPIL